MIREYKPMKTDNNFFEYFGLWNVFFYVITAVIYGAVYLANYLGVHIDHSLLKILIGSAFLSTLMTLMIAFDKNKAK
jgi:hypothetical protein